MCNRFACTFLNLLILLCAFGANFDLFFVFRVVLKRTVCGGSQESRLNLSFFSVCFPASFHVYFYPTLLAVFCWENFDFLTHVIAKLLKKIAQTLHDTTTSPQARLHHKNMLKSIHFFQNEGPLQRHQYLGFNCTKYFFFIGTQR